ncbi:Acetyltransferase SypM [Pseudoalteromonas luteoviolacea B = ATCC 29581]|nr:Acetyltransferase SypM [Pseudoalteromonas luteoviolacea B = ATCC 29581]
MISRIKQWLKHSDSPIAKRLFHFLKAVRSCNVPVIPLLHSGLYHIHLFLSNLIHFIVQQFYFSPIFRSQLTGTKRNLTLHCKMPQILGSLDIQIGDNVRINGISTFCGRVSPQRRAKMTVGNNVDIGWQNAFSVGTQIILEDDVRLAGKVFLAGFPGHPIDPELRAQGASDTEDQIGDIIVKKGAWLGTGVTVLAGVTIGEGSIIGAGSVVTKNIPPNSIAAGNPAKVIRTFA